MHICMRGNAHIYHFYHIQSSDDDCHALAGDCTRCNQWQGMSQVTSYTAKQKTRYRVELLTIKAGVVQPTASCIVTPSRGAFFTCLQLCSSAAR